MRLSAIAYVGIIQSVAICIRIIIIHSSVNSINGFSGFVGNRRFGFIEFHQYFKERFCNVSFHALQSSDLLRWLHFIGLKVLVQHHIEFGKNHATRWYQ